MTDIKLDRANLRRQAQRTESYTSLVSKRKTNLTNGNLALKKSRTERGTRMSDILENNNKENEDEGNGNDNILHVSSPASTFHGASSDSSQEYQPAPLHSLKAMQCNSFQTELEVTSVMTRSASRKYASVGAIHNKVNTEQELKMVKRWPRHVSYQTPAAPGNHSVLRDVVSRSFNEVISLCKQMAFLKSEPLSKSQEEINSWQLDGESASFIDLSPYLTEEPVIINGKDETQITLHLNDTFLPHQFINIISINEDEQDGTLVIQEDNEDYETITLHSGETYFLDNKYFNDVNSTYFESNYANDVSYNTFPEDPMMAVYNDHTYASKYTEKISVAQQPQQLKQSAMLDKDKKNEFKLENALDSLLLNTAILKCLICGETPQDMISFLEKAQTN